MRFDFETQPATLIARPNRYLVHALLADGTQVTAHCPDPGRLRELLQPGATIHLSRAQQRVAPAVPRKTAWDLRFVEQPGHGRLISLDTRVPNALVAEGFQQDFFPNFVCLREIRREVRLPVRGGDIATGPHSRIDFHIKLCDGTPFWIEVKSASHVVSGVARFPDAITERGRRHMRELAALARSGAHTAVIFVVQRPDAEALEAQRETDPAFASALDDAHAAGVQLLAVTCRVTLAEICLDRLIPVRTATRPQTPASARSAEL